MHPELCVTPLADHALGEQPLSGDRKLDSAQIELPILFKTYLRFGSKVCGPPAIDREFKTIDYRVVMDIDGLSPRVHRTFFG